mmetsp:Transcript_26404/g.66446  ORF Transcript_26404/g.66446 Transcript_26404/m.66446 type:complete len:220 (-) Transcript_26404:416-1075(-)
MCGFISRRGPTLPQDAPRMPLPQRVGLTRTRSFTLRHICTSPSSRSTPAAPPAARTLTVAATCTWAIARAACAGAPPASPGLAASPVDRAPRWLASLWRRRWSVGRGVPTAPTDAGLTASASKRTAPGMPAARPFSSTAKSMKKSDPDRAAARAILAGEEHIAGPSCRSRPGCPGGGTRSSVPSAALAHQIRPSEQTSSRCSSTKFAARSSWKQTIWRP